MQIIPEETFADPGLAEESCAGQVLCYKDYYSEICDIIWLIASLPNILDSQASELIYKLRKLLVNLDLTVKEEEVYKIFIGKDPKAAELLVEILAILTVEAVVMATEAEAINITYFEDMAKYLNSVTDYNEIGTIVNAIPEEPDISLELKSKITKWSLFIEYAETILKLYGSGEGLKKPKDKWKVSTIPDLLETCIILQQMIMMSQLPGKVVYLVGSVTSFVTSIAANQLDPYKLDVARNVYEVCSNPDTYEADCKKGSVLRETGNFFSSLYVAYATKSIEEFFHIEDNMTESHKILYKEAVGVDNDNGPLVSICSQFVNRVYNQPT